MKGIGLDAVDVPRFRATLERRAGIADRLFTPDELAYANRHRDPSLRLAARFAAKEAVMKALGVWLGAFSFHEVEVVAADTGEPFLALSGTALELAADAGVTAWELSMTHTASTAQAIAVAL